MQTSTAPPNGFRLYQPPVPARVPPQAPVFIPPMQRGPMPASFRQHKFVGTPPPSLHIAPRQQRPQTQVLPPLPPSTQITGTTEINYATGTVVKAWNAGTHDPKTFKDKALMFGFFGTMIVLFITGAWLVFSVVTSGF